MRFLPALLACCVALAGCSIGGGDDNSSGGGSKPPALGAKSSDKSADVKLGFPSSATGNTIRIGGGDATADAAGAASAVFPAQSEGTRPNAIVLVDQNDWQGAVAAGVLAGTPIGAPTLLSNGGDLPAVTKDTLDRLAPKGSDLTKDAKVIRVGPKPPAPSGVKSVQVTGKDQFETAAAIDKFHSTARGRPSDDVIVASGDEPAYAMPAAAYAARSGSSVLYVTKDAVPSATEAALKAHEKPDIYVLGPKSIVGEKAEKALDKLGKVHRIEGPTPIENAIAFAKYSQGGFGWNATTPGRNFSLADTGRPLDAAASATLGTNGIFAPLLLTDDSDKLPTKLEAYLLDVQPGFEDDPGTAVYNRVWILGDDDVISVAEQGRIDEITELVPVEANSP